MRKVFIDPEDFDFDALINMDETKALSLDTIALYSEALSFDRLC